MNNKVITTINIIMFVCEIYICTIFCYTYIYGKSVLTALAYYFFFYIFFFCCTKATIQGVFER